ncbi:hypothetical protein QP166_15015 [Sphingomonas sp. LR60]|uniref:hypothetical protein n=1 Tax=Sphingomonas sp. LR60 TaxID=3050233 RepID=UPI002FE0F8AB
MIPIFSLRPPPLHDRRTAMIALLTQAALAAQCTPADYLCNLGRAPTYSEQEAGRMAAQRLQAERELIDRQADATRAATSSQADAARVLPRRVESLSASGQCREAAEVAMNGGNIDLARQTLTRCR